ncbi:hypothetical protein COCVIDRAFT_87372, partial [Bipolaris victoriae FI3]
FQHVVCQAANILKRVVSYWKVALDNQRIRQRLHQCMHTAPRVCSSYSDDCLDWIATTASCGEPIPSWKN